MSERLYAYTRSRISVSAFGKLQRCAAGYILSTHYQVLPGLESAALQNGLKVHAAFETVPVVHGYKVIEHEKKIELESPKVGNWLGYIDLICEDDDADRFVVDIKTSKKPATMSWAREYLLSLQGALYTYAEMLETFAIYHPVDRAMFMTQLNRSVSEARLRKAYNTFMGWQSAGQPYKCSPQWSCRFCEYNGHCEYLMNNPGCKLPPTLVPNTKEPRK